MRRAALTAAIAALAICPASADLPEIDTSDIEVEATPPASTQRWISLSLDRPLPERRDPYNFFDPQSTNFRDLLDTIREAEEDEQVQGLILTIESPGLGWSRVQSLRRALQSLREADKEVIAYLEMETVGGYLIATACGEIAMAEEGALLVTGLRMEGIFLRGLLDLLGIEPQIIQMGAYKGAGDMFTERQFTPALREAYTAILDDLWSQMIAMIAEGRGLDPARVEALIDEGPFTAEAAREAGLIDSLSSPGEIERRLEIAAGDGFIFDDEYGEEEPGAMDLNIFNLFTMMQPGAGEAYESDAPKIGLIYATGPIIPGRAEEGPFADPNIINANDFIDLLHECRDDETVRALVVRIDSPGGSAIASDLIWREIVRLREIKPVVVSMGDIAASGGYYIAMGATEIFAEPGTLTGSIGVVGGKMVLTGLLEGHLGITHDTISRGRNAGLFSPFTPFSDSEREAIVTLMQDTYDAFTSKAAESRGLSSEEIHAAAQGRVWTGNLALEHGLVDHLGGLPDALARAEELAGLADYERDTLEIREIPPPENFMEWFTRYMSGQAQVSILNSQFSILNSLDLALLGQIRTWQSLLNREHVLALTPVMLTVR